MTMRQSSYILLIVVSLGLLNAISCVNWSSLNATELKNLPDSDFSGITASQLASIPPTACYGLQSSQIQKIRANAASGFTAACIQYFNKLTNSPCKAIDGYLLQAITPEAISGLVQRCVALIPDRSFAYFSELQLAALTPFGCSGLTADQVSYLPDATGAGLNNSCLQSLPSKACRGLNPGFVGQISSSTFPAFTNSCIAETGSMTFMYMTVQQVVLLSANAFNGFTNQLGYVDPWTISSTSVAQLENLQPLLGNLTANDLAMVIKKYTPTLVNDWNERNCGDYPLTNAYQFKTMIPHLVNFSTTWESISTNVSTATWLQIALLNPVPGIIFPDNFLGKLSNSAVKGLRADHIVQITSASFATLRHPQASCMLKDTIGAMNATQLVRINPSVFGNIDAEGMSGLKVSIIPNITNTQMVWLSVPQIKAMSCDQLSAFTSKQVAQMQNTVQERYHIRMEECAEAPVTPPVNPPVNPPVRPPVSSTPISTPVMSPVMSPYNAPFNAPGMQSGDMTRLVMMLIAGGCGAFIAVSIVGIIWYVKRVRANPERQRLLANPSDHRYERVE